jgi:hypothetical protein
MKFAILLVVPIVLMGCMYPTTIVKTITIERDPAGNIVKKIEEESATQVYYDRQVKLEWIKLVEPPPPSEPERSTGSTTTR